MTIGILLAFLGGTFVALQNTFNANVKRHVSVWTTTALVLGLGFVASLAAGLVTEGMGLFSFHAKAWFWFSGVVGVGVVASVTQGVQLLGPSRAISIVMVSQIFFGLLWDTFGLFGLEKVPFTWQSFAGVLCISAGVLLFQSTGLRKSPSTYTIKKVETSAS